MQIPTIIVEDELRNAQALQKMVEEGTSDIQILAVAPTLHRAYELIRQIRPRLVFLDIKMPHGTGFDLLERLGKIDFDIIFTTAFDHYAIQAINFSALAYLLKPIDREELYRALEKVRHKQLQADRQKNIELLLESLRQSVGGQSVTLEKLALPTLKGYRFVEVRDILYCEADSTYCKVYLRDQTFLVSRNLKEIEKLLRDHSFFRIHRSYLINLNHATEYVKGDGGLVFLSNGVHLPVSQRRRELFVRQLSGRLV